jgi:hypothetical protein
MATCIIDFPAPRPNALEGRMLQFDFIHQGQLD